jgi:hypothetical protein
MASTNIKVVNEWWERMQGEWHNSREQSNKQYTEYHRMLAVRDPQIAMQETKRLERIEKIRQRVYELRGPGEETERDITEIIRDWNAWEEKMYNFIKTNKNPNPLFTFESHQKHFDQVLKDRLDDIPKKYRY